MVSNVYRVSCRRCGTSVNTVTGVIDRMIEASCFDSRRAQEIFLRLQSVQNGSGAHPAPYPRCNNAVSWCKAKNATPYCAKVKNAWSYTSTPPRGFCKVFNFSFNGMFCIRKVHCSNLRPEIDYN